MPFFSVKYACLRIYSVFNNIPVLWVLQLSYTYDLICLARRNVLDIMLWTKILMHVNLSTTNPSTILKVKIYLSYVLVQ